MASLSASRDVVSAAWVTERVHGFGESVLSLVPDGFTTYVRVFHPAYRRVVDEDMPVSWNAIAQANGTRAHAGMQLCALTGSYRFERDAQPGVFDRPPVEGSLPAQLAAVLAAVLAQHTRAPHDCWFAVWNGFGSVIRPDVSAAPTFHLPGRDYHLLHGSIAAVAEGVLAPPCSQSANLWWPDDHAWCVATEIDLKTTYVGCDVACAGQLLARPDIEALAIDPATGISWQSDGLNPPVPSPDS